MRFCMITTFYPPYHFGGDAVFVHRLANALARHGHEVDVIHDVDAWRMLAKTGEPGVVENHSNVKIHPIRRRRLPAASLLLSHQRGAPDRAARDTVARVLRKREPDVVHFHNISLLGGPGILDFRGPVTLCTMHEYWFVCPMHVLWRLDREPCTAPTCVRCTVAGHRPPQLWRYTPLIRRKAKNVDAFIAPSEFARNAVLSRGFPAPVRCLPHFVPDDEVAPLPTGRRPSDFFLYAGRLEKLKGIESLVDAFLSWKGARLVVAGSGSLERELRERTAGSSNIELRGTLPHRELQQLYGDAVAAVVPSLCYETFGLVPIEAFAAGAPAIVRRIGALTELVESSGGGILYDTQEQLVAAMEELLRNPGRRDELGARGHAAFRARYTESVHLRDYFGLIAELKR